MFQITPIGSCRIATPLRLARDRYGIQLNQDRVYGFTHSSAEAVQLMRYLKGEVAIDPALEPLVSRRGISAEDSATLHHPSDLYVVEISSAKLLRIGDTCIQLNYLNSEFADFFADRARAGLFWELAEEGRQDRIDRFLSEAWSDTPHQRGETEILREIRRSTASETDLRRDIRTLIDGLPATLFVTHVDAATPDGKPIPSRSRFIRAVEAAVRAEGGDLYNPTPAMHRMGQARAIEDNSDSLAHFTEDFARAVFRDWFEQCIARRMDGLARAGGEAEVRRLLTPHCEARLALGEAAPLARRLECLAEDVPDSGELRGLLANTYAAVGQSADALRTLREAPVSNDPAIIADLARRRFHLALELAEADEADAALLCLEQNGGRAAGRELLAAAELFLKSGRRAVALDAAVRALDRDAGLARAADIVADLSDPTALSALQDRLKDCVVRLLPATRRLQFLYHSDGPAALFAPGGPACAVAADDLRGVADWIVAQGDPATAATLVACWRRAQSPDRLLHPGLRALVDRLVQDALSLPDRAQRIAGLERALHANPLHVEARMALRSLRRDLLAEMRAHAEAGDIAALEALAPEVACLEDPIRDYDLLRMRVCFAQGRLAEALAAARKVTEDKPDNMVAWATMMRAAQKTGEFLTVDEAARRILDKADDDSRRLAEEAQDRLDRNPVQCFRAARETDDPLQAIRLFDIARRDPALTRASDIRLRRLEAQLAATARALETDAGLDAETFLTEATRLLPESPRLRLAAGRYLVRQRDYAAALPHWEFLTSTSPGNETYMAQRDRCRDRLTAVTSG